MSDIIAAFITVTIAAHPVIVRGEMPTNPTGPVVIEYSPGGHVTDGIRKVQMTVRGPCLSGCAWAFVENEHRDTCYSSAAIFAFHEFKDRIGNSVPEATAVNLARTPAHVIDAIGPAMTGSHLQYFTAAQMAAKGIGRFCVDPRPG